jgi:tetratricopeptide (TPR) repeat protein
VKLFAVTLILLLAYLAVIFPFTDYQWTRPVAEKMGYVPTSQVLKAVSADHKGLSAAVLVLKSMMYFGGIAESRLTTSKVAPDYQSMYGALATALKLDPYNMDAYYFAQAFLVWDAHEIKAANAMLDYGMKYRSWDFMLPFFAGFNSAYFLKDYSKAAGYYKKAGELSGSELFVNLAGRYLWQSGRTEQAIAYLAMMEKGAGNDAVRRSFQTRLQALREVRRIEEARDRFRATEGRQPKSVEELSRWGGLSPAPRDPYGGRFYLEPDGQVATTSKFSSALGAARKP